MYRFDVRCAVCVVCCVLFDVGCLLFYRVRFGLLVVACCALCVGVWCFVCCCLCVGCW